MNVLRNNHNMLKIKHILFIIISFSASHMDGQTSQILIETQLTKYSNDVKTNTYYLTLTPSGGVSKGFSYKINNNDDNEKYFYDLIQLDITNYPINFAIEAFNRVKPTIIGGPECSQSYQGKISYQSSSFVSACHGISSLLLLDLPIPKGPIGNCKTISIEKNIPLKNASYSWEYRKGNETQWNYFYYGRDYSANGLNFVPNQIPELANFTGNLYIRFIVTNENLNTDKIDTFISNVTNYVLTDCSPQYAGGIPPSTGIRCNGESNGTVTLKFKSELVDGDVFLFNIFLNKTPQQFIKHHFVSKSDIKNDTYVWTNLGAGDYIITYQAQRIGDPNQQVKGLSLEPIPPFTIANRDPLIFKLTAIQPACNDGKGKIQISAEGGTPPYFYMLENETIDDKHPFTSPYIIPKDFLQGEFKVKVIDSNDCIEKSLEI